MLSPGPPNGPVPPDTQDSFPNLLRSRRAGWSPQTVTPAESGAVRDLGGKTGGGGTGQNPAGARGLRGEGRARPPGCRKGEKGDQRMSPRARRRAVSKRHLPPGSGAERSRAGAGRDPPGTSRASSGTHSRRPCGRASAPGLGPSSAPLCPRWPLPLRPASALETRAAVRTRGLLLKKITYFQTHQPPPPSLQTGPGVGTGAGPVDNNGRWAGSGPAIGWREE